MVMIIINLIFVSSGRASLRACALLINTDLSATDSCVYEHTRLHKADDSGLIVDNMNGWSSFEIDRELIRRYRVLQLLPHCLIAN